MRYEGTYPTHHGQFACFCTADSFDQAQQRMDTWNIGATVTGVLEIEARVPVPTESGFEHWLVYLMWLGMSAGLLGVDALRDDGLIHDLMHLHEGVDLVADDPMPQYLELCRKLFQLP